GGNGVIEKGGMNGFANNIVAAKTERDVRDTAAHLGVWQVGLDPAGRVDVVNRVVVVLLHPGGDGENVGIEDNVFGREPDFIYQDFVSAFANADLVFVICGLALFVEGHYDGSGAVFQDGSGMLAKYLFAFFQRNRIDNALALQAFQACLDDLPLGGIDYDRNLRHLRF